MSDHDESPEDQNPNQAGAPPTAPAVTGTPEVLIDWTVGDVARLPSPPAAGMTDTKVFHVYADELLDPITGDRVIMRSYSITIKTDGKHHAQEFYRLLNCMSRALKDTGQMPGAEDMQLQEDGVSVTYPFSPEIVKVDEPGYLGNIYTLAAVTVKPQDHAGNPDFWIIFGHKNGPEIMHAIFDWVNEKNGLEKYMKDRMAEVYAEKKAKDEAAKKRRQKQSGT
jgi:hypothetical protein